jgi:hypothetical protein
MITRKIEYISLLYFANQSGRKISKLSLVESEYFRVINVTGQILLNTSKIRLSIKIRALHIIPIHQSC